MKRYNKATAEWLRNNCDADDAIRAFLAADIDWDKFEASAIRIEDLGGGYCRLWFADGSNYDDRNEGYDCFYPSGSKREDLE